MATDRQTLLCDQAVLTGIDFVTVEDPDVQTTLRVFFLLDPPSLDPAPDGWDTVPDLSEVRIWAPSGGNGVVEPTVTGLAWLVDAVSGRTYLEVTVDQPGDFSLYRLEISDDTRVDYYYSKADFSFKQACPTTLDCKLVTPDQSCPASEDELELNPLARDFVSLRRALLDYANQKFDTWTYRSDADIGVVLIELMAAIGDEFNYVKDRFAREGILDELSQRRSLRQLARLLDYEIHDGRNPKTLLELEVVGEDISVAAGTPVWVQRFGEDPITFELGEGIADYRTLPAGTPRAFDVDERWNNLGVYEPDGDAPALAKGATEMYLVGHVDAALGDLWATQGRALIVHEDPSDGSQAKRHLVHVLEVEELTDALTDDEITRVAWDASEALPCAMTIVDMSVKANVVPATAGQSFEEFFHVRGDGSLPEVVERQGPLDSNTGLRSPLFRYSPSKCEALGLGWLGQLVASTPEIEVQAMIEGQPDWDLDNQWMWRRTLLDSTPTDTHFTIEDGTWRRIIGYRLPDGSELVHRDWAADAGYTLRFGDGEFGQIPGDETEFRVRYRSGPGAAANVNAGTIVHLSHPVTGDPPVDANILAVTNPFDVVDGADPEAMQRAKFLAPEAYRQETFNAVTPADYRRLAETELAWVQRANATFRWTGSWMTIFVAADPIGAYAMTAAQQAELEDLMDCARQVGRDVFVLEPDYIDLDVRVEVCPDGGSYTGQVEAAVREALTGVGGFFDPDAFTFGTALRRSALEAAIQRVAGVHAVLGIELRAREKTGWFEFGEASFEVGSGQIIRCVNDPRVPEQGTVKVRVKEVV